MKAWIEKIYQGSIGRLLRSALQVGLGTAVAHWQKNEWYISIAPLLATIGKKLRDKYPGQFEWLPF